MHELSPHVRHRAAKDGRDRNPSGSRLRLDVVEEAHEAEIHMQLLVAVEKGHAGVVRDNVYLGFLVAAKHDHVFHEAVVNVSLRPESSLKLAMLEEQMRRDRAQRSRTSASLLTPEI